MKVRNEKDLENLAQQGREKLWNQERKIIVGFGTCGISAGARQIYNQVEKVLEREGIDATLSKVGCVGLCHREPMLDVQIKGKARVSYANIDSESVSRIIKKHVLDGEPVKDLAFAQIVKDPSALDLDFPDLERYDNIPTFEDLDFVKKQTKVAMRNCGIINPTSIEEYIARGGYYSAISALHDLSRDEIIETILNSNLRGRGGAGFPTDKKWTFARKAEGDEKYMICNADEGDPGAYMDRSILEGDPHSIIEGMIIGSYAVGAETAYIYVRAEYPLAIERLKKAIDRAYECGILGDNVMGSNFSLNIELKQGAGAFVCGEETALIHSIEGKRGEPRSRPPYPANQGLRGKPTNINNVETWANVAAILSNGSEWFSSIGTEQSGGTKVFSLVGKINRPGLVEAPFGTELGEVIFDIGGGIPGRKEFKAVQTGGPSGGVIPSDYLDVEIDYENLDELGSIMGSGGIVVMDEEDCMADVAKYFLGFTSDESCGKCTPCREGLKQMLNILDRICSGQADEEDIQLLEDLSLYVRESALCGLGNTAVNPILTTLEYFRDEYIEHIEEGECPAGVCSMLMKSPCQNRCPADTDVPGYVQLIKEERYIDAYNLSREANPFTATLSRICPHPCEIRCERGKLDEPIAIRDLKRFISDYRFENENEYERSHKISTLSEREEQIAIIGGGPNGLSVAYFLKRLGYGVTIFEASDELGGLLNRYKKDSEIINKEIQDILDLGVVKRINTSIERDISLRELLKEFDAIFIDAGATIDRPLGISGDISEEVLEKKGRCRQSQVEKIFVNREIETDAEFVVKAVGDGKNMAGEIDEFISGENRIEELQNLVDYDYESELPEIIEDVSREKIEGLDEKAAVKEASRCLRCDLG